MTDWLLHASRPLLWSRLNTVIIMSSQDIIALAISHVWGGKKMFLNTFHFRNQFIFHLKTFYVLINCKFLCVFVISLLLWMGLLTTSLFLKQTHLLISLNATLLLQKHNLVTTWTQTFNLKKESQNSLMASSPLFFSSSLTTSEISSNVMEKTGICILQDNIWKCSSALFRISYKPLWKETFKSLWFTSVFDLDH